jgi:predicted transcriptional regulator
MDKLKELEMVIQTAVSRYLSMAHPDESRTAFAQRDELQAAIGKRMNDLRLDLGYSLEHIEVIYQKISQKEYASRQGLEIQEEPIPDE